MNKKVYEDTLQIASLALFDIKLGENGLDLNGNDVKQTAKNAFDEIEKSKNEIARRSQHSEAKLSIPKKIAELLDIGYAYEGDEERDHSWLIHNMDDFTSSESYYKFYSWLEDSKDNYSLAITYLAGKALGVELVEVSDE